MLRCNEIVVVGGCGFGSGCGCCCCCSSSSSSSSSFFFSQFFFGLLVRLGCLCQDSKLSAMF